MTQTANPTPPPAPSEPPASTNPAATPARSHPLLEPERLKTLLELGGILLVVVGALASGIGWFLHGIWAHKNGIIVNQGWNFQYTAVGFIPAYAIIAILLNVGFSLHCAYRMVKDTRPLPSMEDKRQKINDLNSNTFSGLGLFYLVSVVFWVLIIGLIDPAYGALPFLDHLMAPYHPMPSTQSPSPANAFITWLIIPSAYAFMTCLVFMGWIRSLLLGTKSRKTWSSIGMLVYLVLFAAMVRAQQPQDYYTVLPQQLGGAQVSHVQLMVEDAPAELYPGGKAPKEGVGRTQTLDLIYASEDYFVVRLPKHEETYQLTKDQVKTLITEP